MSNARFLERRVAEAFYGGFPGLRDVQEDAIEPILGGSNIVLSSGTGSGKTEAVMAPLLSRFWQELFSLDSLVIVYVSPTKALANDLYRRLEPTLDQLNLRIGIRHGDRDDLRKKSKPHVVITTPESLDVLLLRQDKALETVLAVVVDEVHLFYNTQRGIQISVLIQRLQEFVKRPPLQLVAMSATIANLEQTAGLIFGMQSNTEFLRFASHRQIDAVVRDDGVEPLISTFTKEKERKILAFVNARKYAEYFAQELSEEEHLQKSAFSHYSSLDDRIRRDIEKKFAKRKTAVCFATGTLELGIDIGDIDAVLLLGVPAGIASFLQRIGRGNRREDKSNVVCFVGADNFLDLRPPAEPPLIEALRYIALIDSAQKGDLAFQHRYELFGAVGQQCLSVIASRKGKYTSLKELAPIFEHLGYVPETVLKSILDALVTSGYLKKHGYKTHYGAAELLHNIVSNKKIYGNFPTEPQMVKLIHKDLVLGELPRVSLGKAGQGTPVIFAAKKWIIEKIEEDAVYLLPLPPEAFALPFSYIGDKPRFDAFLTDKMWHLIHEHEFPYNMLHKDLRTEIEKARKVAQALFTVNDIPYTERANFIRYYTFGGLLVNTAIALLYGDTDLRGVTDCYVELSDPVDWNSLPSDPSEFESIFPSLAKRYGRRSLFQTLLPPALRMREGIQEWLCDEAIRNVLQRLTQSKPLACVSGDKPFPLEQPAYLPPSEK